MLGVWLCLGNIEGSTSDLDDVGHLREKSYIICILEIRLNASEGSKELSKVVFMWRDDGCNDKSYCIAQ